jgi:anti-sigma-K factor RskA
MKSWKTTLAGVAAIVAAVATAVSAQFDNNPATFPDWTLVIGMITAGVGLMFARDDDKTSEQVGAGK